MRFEFKVKSGLLIYGPKRSGPSRQNWREIHTQPPRLSKRFESPNNFESAISQKIIPSQKHFLCFDLLTIIVSAKFSQPPKL
jgi:hypothetical protein